MKLLSLITALVLCSIPLFAQDNEKGSTPKRHGEHKRAWSELSKDEQEKVRSALKVAWSDSKVLSARANVNQSIEEYQTAIREAIGNQDSETVKLLEKIQHTGLLNSTTGHKRAMMQRPFEQIRLFPHIVEQLTETEAKTFKQTSEKVSELPEVISSWEKLKQLRKENDAINRRQFEAIRNFRRIYLDKIIELAPELSDQIDLEKAGPMKGKGRPKGKGKGRPMKKEQE